MVVDEVMTAARCSFDGGTALLVDTYKISPLFVTVGKPFGAGIVLCDEIVSKLHLPRILPRWPSTAVAKSTLKSIGIAIQIVAQLMELQPSYMKQVEQTVRKLMESKFVVGYGLLWFTSDKYASSNPGAVGCRRFLFRFSKHDGAAAQQAHLLKWHTTTGNFLEMHCKQFQQDMHTLCLPFKAGSHPAFTLTYALAHLAFVDSPAIQNKKDIPAVLAEIIKLKLQNSTDGFCGDIRLLTSILGINLKMIAFNKPAVFIRVTSEKQEKKYFLSTQWNKKLNTIPDIIA